MGRMASVAVRATSSERPKMERSPTSIIAPPDGDLRQYLSSLERLAALPGIEVAYPAHGPAVTEPVMVEELPEGQIRPEGGES